MTNDVFVVPPDHKGPGRLVQLLLLLVVLIVLAIIGFGLALAAEQGPAGSKLPKSCGSHDQVLSSVVSPPYGEEVWRIRKGWRPSGVYVGVVEWTENTETGTWTVLVTQGGIACVLFSGTEDGPKT